MPEIDFRVTIFIAVYALAWLLELLFARRQATQVRLKRWFTNFGLLSVDILLQRFTVGAAAYVAAIYAQQHGWGLLHFTNGPFWLEALFALLLLDFAIYMQHVLTHRVTWLWRVHRVHHTDLDIDASSGLRFHPIEILLSLVYKAGIVLLFGIDAWVVLLFEALLSSASVWIHANIHLPVWMDKSLRYILCTPDMHRVHHSIKQHEMDSNFGTILSVWDRCCGTYISGVPFGGHQQAKLGLSHWQQANQLQLWQLLIMPFKPIESVGESAASLQTKQKKNC